MPRDLSPPYQSAVPIVALLIDEWAWAGSRPADEPARDAYPGGWGHFLSAMRVFDHERSSLGALWGWAEAPDGVAWLAKVDLARPRGGLGWSGARGARVARGRDAATLLAALGRMGPLATIHDVATLAQALAEGEEISCQASPLGLRSGAKRL